MSGPCLCGAEDCGRCYPHLQERCETCGGRAWACECFECDACGSVTPQGDASDSALVCLDCWEDMHGETKEKTG